MNEVERMRQMSARELAFLGIQDLAYVKRVEIDGAAAYSVHAADGTRIAVLPGRDIAFATLRQHDLEPLSVH